MNFKEEISSLLDEEISSRYFYQKGRIQTSLKTDKDIEKATDTFRNTTYSDILAGKSGELSTSKKGIKKDHSKSSDD
jgi:carboxyl-terminal processing protease